MDQEQYNWEVELVQSRFQHLDLTFSQAEKVYEYEMNQHGEPIFSLWGELDHEHDTFKSFLTDVQWEEYTKRLNIQTEGIKKGLIEEDLNYVNHIKYTTEILHHLEHVFLPSFYNKAEANVNSWLKKIITYKPTIDLIKVNYSDFLNRSKREILVNHYRFNRTYKPNELKNSLLDHQLLYHLPNFWRFKPRMNESTRLATDHLLKNTEADFKNIEASIMQKFENLNEYAKVTRLKYFDEAQGWRVKIELNTKEEFENRLLTALLLAPTMV